MQISPESDNSRLPELQHIPVNRVRNGKDRDQVQPSDSLLHPDLQELNFGPLGASSNNLPAPLRPLTGPYHDSDRNVRPYDARGSLSDFSDYDSSEDRDPREGFSSQTKDRKDYLEVSDGSDEDTLGSGTNKPDAGDADPFADPFADEVATGLSRK
jgi:hypothetical protein